MTEQLTKERLAEIAARRAAIKKHDVDSEELDEFYDAAADDIDALIADNERLAALLEDARREIDDRESELAVYRVTVLGVNVAAGQGED